MEVKFKNYFLLMCIALLMFTASCRYLKDKENDPDPVVNRSFKISGLNFTAHEENEKNYNRQTFFNSKGEPTYSIVRETETGNMHYKFEYDEEGHLVKTIEHFYNGFAGDTIPDNQLASYHKYSNDVSGRIIIDSFFTPSRLITVSNFTYDEKNRISSGRLFLEGSVIEETFYTYGADGNLTSGQYDNKNNYLKNSKVLQFLARDYSVNNLIVDESRYVKYNYEYNLWGYPKKISGNQPGLTGVNLSSIMGVTTVSYTY